MPASLAETLYHTWRRAQHDITEHPAWGNLASEQRVAWERVAELARQEVNAESLRNQAKAREPYYCPGCGRDINPLNQHERDSSQACICSGLDVCECGHERDDHPRGICWTVGCGCGRFALKERAA